MKRVSLLKRLTALAVTSCLASAQLPLLPAQAVSMPDFSELGAVGTLTEAQTKAAAESIYSGLVNHQSTAVFSTSSSEYIPATNEAMDSVMQVFATVVGGWDVGIFAVKNRISTMLSRSVSRGNYIKGISIYYLVDDAAYDKEYQTIMGKLDAISAQVEDSWSDAEKALFFHEYLAVHYNYDYTDYETDDEEYYCHTAYNLLKTDKGVCEAYAWLYNVLMRREDIPSYMITSDTLMHAWNLINLGDEWFHVDITWDDVYQEHAGIVRHDNFLKGHDAIYINEHDSTDWVLSTGVPESDLNVSDFYDEAFWNDSQSAIQYYQGHWLTIVPDTQTPTVGWFNAVDFDPVTAESESTPLLSLSERWTVPGGTAYYNTTYIVPAVYEDYLLYSTPTSVMVLADGEPHWLFDLTEQQKSESRIYGIYVDGDTLYYDLSASPVNSSVTQHSFSLSGLFGEIEMPSETSATETTATTTTETTTTTTTTTTSTTTSTTTTTTRPTTTTSTTTTTTRPTTTTSTTTTTTRPTTTTSTTTAATTTTETETKTTETKTIPEETAALPSETVPEPVVGDLDGDGELSVNDVVFVQRYIMGWGTMTPEELACADLDHDDCVDVFDLALFRYELLTQ